LGLADVEARVGDVAAAEQVVRAWFGTNDTVVAGSLAGIAYAQEQDGAWAVAAQVHGRVVTLLTDTDQQAAAWQRIGDLWREKLRDPARALEAYQQQARILPNDILPVLLLSRAFEDLGDEETACSMLEQAVSRIGPNINPSSGPSDWIKARRLVVALVKLGHLQEASDLCARVESASASLAELTDQALWVPLMRCVTEWLDGRKTTAVGFLDKGAKTAIQKGFWPDLSHDLRYAAKRSGPKGNVNELLALLGIPLDT
jgi:tetratricopeptide (TPR) repeat protein